MNKLEKDFLGLISQYNAMIHKVVHLYRDTPEDREDLFQEIVFQLWKSYPNFKAESKISTWMYRIALNTAIASFRKQKSPIKFLSQLPDLAEEQVSEELLVRQERFFSVLKVLDDGEKALITLYFEDLSYQQISEVVGISENYVGVKINGIKAKIKNLLNRKL